MKALIKPINQPPRIETREAPIASKTNATVRIHYVGLCRTDLRVAIGDLPVNRGIVLGHECSGVVVADPSGRFVPGALVAVNPLLEGEQFLGLHCDGALQELLQIPSCQLVPADGVPLKIAAYLEPVAASMAVLKARISRAEKGVIYQSNRISHLTWLILQSMGYDIEWQPGPPTGNDHNKFDYAIETLFDEDVIQATLHALKPGGLLVVKSRQYRPTAIVPGLLVAKELTLQAVNYYDFFEAMSWLRKHQELLMPLLGDTFALDDWAQAFDAALQGDAKKIFISLE